MVVGVQVSETTNILMKKVAESRGISKSEYIRQLILADLERKALFPSRETGILEIPNAEKEAQA